MRKTALGIMAVGFCFAFFSIQLAGIDILIDAVGFLLVANGLWAFRKLQGSFVAAAAGAAALMVVAALQLFAAGTGAGVLLFLRRLLEASLYALMLVGFAGQPFVRQKKGILWVVRLGLGLAALAALAALPGIWLGYAIPVLVFVFQAGQLVVLGLVVLLLALPDAPQDSV